MAGLGAPEVSQCRMTDMPSITVLSEGPAVIFGAIPAGATNTQGKYKEQREKLRGLKGRKNNCLGQKRGFKRFFVSASLLRRRAADVWCR